MARTLDFKFGSTLMACAMSKVDRSKLYGYVRTEVLDEQDRPCELATLASDGKTLIPLGGVALATLSTDGMWKDKSELEAVDPEGNPIEPVPSSFNAPITLKETASVEEYFDHNIRMLYQLESEDGLDPALEKELAAGTIFKFPFSYRGGLVADAGFLLRGEDASVWLAVGSPTEIHLIGYEQAGFTVTEDDDSGAEEGDLMDFGMM